MTTDGRPRYTRQSSSPAIAAMSSRHNAPNQVQSHWPTRVASVESLQFTALPSAHPTASASTSNLLKKRHSSYALSSAATPMTMDRTVSLPVPPLPDLPLPLASGVPMPAHQQPSRPPRNPARIPAPLSLYSTSQTSLVSTGANGITIVQSASIHPPLPHRRSKVNKGSRPSTAESTSTNASASISIRERSVISQDRQDITPWEFQSLREEKVSFEGEKHTARTPLSATATSPTAASLKSRASSVGTSATGPIEEVTPWELYPIPPSPRQYQQPAGAGKGAPSITSRSSSSSNSNSKKSREARSNSTSSNSLSNSNSLPTPTPYALGFASASSSHLSYVSSSPYPSAPPSASSGAGFNVGPSTPLSSQAPTQKERTFLPHSPSTSTLGSASSSNFNLRLHHSQSHPNPTHSSHPHPHPLTPYTPYTPLKMVASSLSTSTGPVEDVTPWELHPGPASAIPGAGVVGAIPGSGSIPNAGLGVVVGPENEHGYAHGQINNKRISEEIRRSVDSSGGIKTGTGVMRTGTGTGSASGSGTTSVGASVSGLLASVKAGMGVGSHSHSGGGVGGAVNNTIGNGNYGRKRSGSLVASAAAAAAALVPSSSSSNAGGASAAARRSLPHAERSPHISAVPSLPDAQNQNQKYHAHVRQSLQQTSSNPISTSARNTPIQTPTQTPLTKATTGVTATGPMEEVTPWELEDALPEPLKERVDFGFGLGMTSTAATAAIAGGALTSASTSSSRSVMSFSGSVDVGVEGRHERERELESGGGKVKSVGSERPRGSMTLEQLEEVMPWELYPAPALALEDGREAGLEDQSPSQGQSQDVDGKEKTTSGTQASSSTSQGQQTSSHTRQSVAAAAFAEFGLRRRRSTGHGGSGSHAPSGPVAGSGSNTVIGKMRTGKDKDGGKDKSRISTTIQNGLGLGSGISSTMFPPAVGNVPILPMSSSFSAPGITTSASTSSTNTASSSAYTDLGSTSASSTTTADTTNASSEGNGNGNRAPKFSTADRTILEQIKAHLQAREAQFKIKGIGHTVVGGGYSPGKKHHLYDKKEVPYPRSYGKEVVDLDVWETMTALDIAGSLTWHVFSTPPTKVLDIGCGTGTWILQCAGTWKECHFVGLDIVPLHPNLQNVGSSDFASRVTWVQHNFLDVLPFQTEEFDFVHIKRIALGVPEDKWDTLFEEIARVMKPGAALELAEEDLFFPGKPIDDDEEEIISVTPDDSSSVTRRNSISSDRHRSSVSAVNGVDKLVEVSERSSHETSVTAVPYTVPPRAGPSRPGSPSRGKSRFEGQSTSIAPPPADDGASVVQQLYTPHSRSAARPALSVKTLSSDPYADFAASHPSLFGSNVAVLGGIAYSASQDPFMEILKQQKQERASSLATKASMPSSPAKTKPSPFLMRSLANKAPTNPRDHMILEAIWNGMLESRFVNLTPLSLLTTYLEYHFKDVRTHPPLRYTFPPVPPKVYDDDSDEDDDNPAPQHPSDSEPDTDDARDAVIPMSKRHRSTKARKSAKRGSSTPTASHGDEQLDERRWLSMQALFQHESPYVSLDESRGFTYSPSRKGFSSNHASKESQSSKLRNVSMLPNQNLNIDIRTLNLHLALRAKEIIACSESMWEWVQEYQAEVANDPSRNSRFRSGSIEGFMVGADPAASGSSLDLTHNAILEMTRDDFDHLLNNFEMDMQDKASVGHALAQRFDWHVFTSPVLQDRKVFDTACKKYDKWLAAQRKAKAPGGPYHQSNNHHSRNSMSAPGLVPSIPESSTSGDSNVISRSISSLPQSTSVDETSSIAATLVPTSNRRDSNDTALPSPSVSHESITSISPQRLSRATRVFVAWKALEKETKQVH